MLLTCTIKFTGGLIMKRIYLGPRHAESSVALLLMSCFPDNGRRTGQTLWLLQEKNVCCDHEANVRASLHWDAMWCFSKSCPHPTCNNNYLSPTKLRWEWFHHMTNWTIIPTENLSNSDFFLFCILMPQLHWDFLFANPRCSSVSHGGLALIYHATLHSPTAFLCLLCSLDPLIKYSSSSLNQFLTTLIAICSPIIPTEDFNIHSDNGWT